MPNNSTDIVLTVPPNYLRPVYKITIAGIDVSSHLINCGIDPAITDDIDSASIILDNLEGRYAGEFVEGDEVLIYADYSSGTYQVFGGKFYTPEFICDASNGETMSLECRGFGYAMLTRRVSEDYATEDTITNILQYLWAKYFPDYTQDFTHIATITTTYLPQWSRKSFKECLDDLKEAAGGNYDFRVHWDKILYFYEKNSIQNTNVIAVYKENIINYRIVGKDLLKLTNKLWLYGHPIGDIPRVKVFQDTTSQTTYGETFEDEVEDDTLDTDAKMTAKGDSLISLQSTLEKSGSITIVGDGRVLPGEQIMILIWPASVMEYMRVASVHHELSSSGFTTQLTIEEKERGFTTFIQDSIKRKQKLSVRNKWGMENSHVMEFFTDNYGSDTQTPDSIAELQTMSDTVVWEDRLMQELNTSSGYAITKTITTSNDVSQFVVMVDGSNLESDDGESWITFEINFQGNPNGPFQSITTDTVITPNVTGKNVVIKVTMISLTSKIRAIGFLWK